MMNIPSRITTYVLPKQTYKLRAMLILFFLACSVDEFSSKVHNETRPVFLFCLSPFHEDFSPEVKQFAKSHSHLAIYGIGSSMVAQLTIRFKTPTTSSFMLWKDGKMVTQYTGTDFSAFMRVLQAIDGF